MPATSTPEPVTSDPVAPPSTPQAQRVDEAVAAVGTPPRTIEIPTAQTRPAPSRVVARVGAEEVTISELTDAVKARLALLPADRPPTRRQVIALARSVLEGMLQRSLVVQEAESRLSAPGARARVEGQIRRQWDEHDLPNLIRRERLADASALDARLAERCLSIATLRERHQVRELGLELARRDPEATATERTDLNAYLDRLRKRYPITSLLTPAEIAAAAGDPGVKGRSEAQAAPLETSR